MVIGGDAVQTMDYLMNNRDLYTDEQIEAAADYYQKKARSEGMMDGVIDRVDLMVATADAQVMSEIHRASKQRIIATSGENVYYITAGEVGTDPETGNVILIGTGGAVVGRDISTGATEVLNPSNVQLYSVEKVDDLINFNHTTLREKFMQQADDDITYGSPAQEVLEQEDTVTLNDGKGGVIEGQIGMLPNSADGVYVVYTNDGKALQLTEDELNRRIVAHNGVEVVRGGAQQETEQEAAAMQQPTEQEQEQQLEATENAQTAGNYAQNGGENIPEQSNTGVENIPEEQPTALSRIPVRTDENGQPVTNRKGKPILDWHKASVEDASAALIETTGGDMVMARDTAADMVRNSQAQLEKIRKQKPKGDDPIEIAESRMDIRRQEQEQQQIIRQWQDVSTSIRKLMEKEIAERRAAEEAAKSEEQRRIEAEEARNRKQQQDEAARKRLEEEIEKDRKRREKPYEPLVKARQEMAGDADALTILNDTEPRSLEEHVSSLLRPHSILWLDASDSERGLRSELGLNRSDMQRFMHLLGTRESGAKSFDTVVVDIHQALPESLKEQFTDADVRNVVLELFRSSENSTKMMNLTAENRIEEAREMMRENDRMAAEYEMQAWAEAYHLNPEEREAWEEFMSIPPTPIEEHIINQIIEDQYEQQNQGNGSLDKQSVIGTDTAGVEGGETEVRQETQATGGRNPQTESEQAAEAPTGEPSVAGNTVDGGVIPVPEVDMQRMQALRENLTEAYQSGEPGAIVNAAKGIQDYVDEGLDDYAEYEEGIEDYEGNDPEKLADQYITRVFHDRYLDNDADQEYIRTGIKQSEQLKPTDLRDATRVESPEIGVSEANARARGDNMIGRSLTEEEADDLILESAARAEQAPELELTPENWQAEFGNGILSTPIGDVKLSENQYSKTVDKGRAKEVGMIKPTLTDPDFIIEVASEAKDGNTERPTSYLFVKAFIGKDGKKQYFFKSVTVQKDGMEVNVSNHLDRPKRLRESLGKGKLLYRFNGGAQTEQSPATVSVTTSRTNPGVSASKGSGKSSNLQGKGEKNGQVMIQGLGGYTEDEVLSLLRSDIEERCRCRGCDAQRHGLAW